MYKVFFNDRTIYLDDNLPDMNAVGKDYVCAFENITDLKPQVKQFLDPDKTGNLYIFHDDQESLFRTFKQCFTNVAAAGGLLRNGRDEVLVIFRRGKWDLPKGKLEKGETPRQAAIREVEEECGLKGIEIGDLLETTFHIYEDKGVYILKRTDWFNMMYTGSAEPSPRTQEDITETRWIRSSATEQLFSNTYASIIEVFRSAKAEPA
jgi:8-oxo-dGTP pyrophosphatase MutT (NUDIX family)